jgi:hypothetical protein
VVSSPAYGVIPPYINIGEKQKNSIVLNEEIEKKQKQIQKE